MGHLYHMDISHLHPCKKHLHQKIKKNLDLHHALFTFIEDGHQGQQFRVCHWHDGAQWLHIALSLVRPVKAFIIMAKGMTFAFDKTKKDEKKNKTNSDEK